MNRIGDQLPPPTMYVRSPYTFMPKVPALPSRPPKPVAPRPKRVAR